MGFGTGMCVDSRVFVGIKAGTVYFTMVFVQQVNQSINQSVQENEKEKGKLVKLPFQPTLLHAPKPFTKMQKSDISRPLRAESTACINLQSASHPIPSTIRIPHQKSHIYSMHTS